jgi:OOP family OmpA-OmpF porin
MYKARDFRGVTALAGLAVALLAPRAALADCSPATGISPCIDSEALWLPATRARFLSMPSAERLGQGGFAAGFGVGYMSRPIVLRAPSPDPEGRDVDVVDDVVDATLLYAYGITHEIELTAALPFVAYQTGAGAAGATSQAAGPIAPNVLRDPRIGVGFALLWRGNAERGYGAKTRIELGIPLGDEDVLAGDSSVVVAPSAVLEVRHDRFSAASELGLRLRRTVELADVRWGPQATVTLGAGFDIFRRERLSVAVEASVAPVLISQKQRLSRTGTVADAVIVPAEWLASVRSQLVANVPFTLQLGGGTGIPLSVAQRTAADGSEQTETFTSPTTPTWRAVLVARYTSE